MSDTCPECGSNMTYKVKHKNFRDGKRIIGTYSHGIDDRPCLRRQLAQCKEREGKLRYLLDRLVDARDMYALEKDCRDDFLAKATSIASVYSRKGNIAQSTAKETRLQDRRGLPCDDCDREDEESDCQQCRAGENFLAKSPAKETDT